MKYVLDPSTTISWSEIPTALVVITLVALHVVAWGYWITRWIGYKPADFWAQCAVRGGIGFVLLGAEMLLLGHLRALVPVSLSLSSVIMLVSLVPAFPRFVRWLPAARQELRSILHEDRVIAISCAVMLLMVAVSGIRPPNEVDEREYHWAAPLMWADKGQWVPTPFHNTNGPALGEIIFTFSAIFGTPIAAHWTHSLFLLVLLAGCASLAHAMGGRVIAALGACLAAPVIVNESVISYTDVAAAAFVIAAYVALFCEAKSDHGRFRPTSRAILIASILFAGSLSVKPVTMAALPVAMAYVAWPAFLHRRLSPEGGWNWLFRAALLAIPVVLTFFLWSLRTYALTGDWSSRQDEISRMTVRSASDHRWQTGQAVARIPSIGDIARLPIDLIITPILGQREPYGSRTGLPLLLVPIGLFGLRRLPECKRRTALWLLVAAGVFFFSLGAIALKTRYHIFVWVVGACLASIAYDVFRNSPSPFVRRAGKAAYYLLMWLGMADIAHVILRNLTPYY